MNLILRITLLFVASVTLVSCQQLNTSTMKQPKAQKIEKQLVKHGHTRIDNYYWLKERENPEVIDYLKAENAYTKEVMKDTEILQEKIYNEIVGRIKQTDISVPYNYNGYSYFIKYEEG